MNTEHASLALAMEQLPEYKQLREWITGDIEYSDECLELLDATLTKAYEQGVRDENSSWLRTGRITH